VDYSLATLLALEHLQDSLSITKTEVTQDTMQVILQDGKKLSLPLPDNWKEYARRYQISASLKGKSLEDFEECFVRLVLAESFLTAMESASLIETGDDWLLLYWFRGKKKQKKLRAIANVQEHYDLLLVARAVYEGYTITELIGSHIIINTPSGARRRCTPNHCDCQQFIEVGKYVPGFKCIHLKIVDYYLSDRLAFQDTAKMV